MKTKFIILTFLLILLSSFASAVVELQQQQVNTAAAIPSQYNAEYGVFMFYNFEGNKNYTLNTIQIQLRKTGTPTGDLNIKIYDVDGSQLPNTLLATSSTKAISTITAGSWVEYNFTFASPPSIYENTNYSYVLVTTGTPSTSNYIENRVTTTSGIDGYGSNNAGLHFIDTSSASHFSAWGENITSSPTTNVSNFVISAISIWDSTGINNFTADINGTNYSTTNGTLITPLLDNSTQLHNITIYSTNWFSREYNNYNVSSTLQAQLKQSQINFNCYEKISNNSLTCINGTIYPNANNYNFTIEVGGYYDITQEETINALDNTTLNFTDFYSTLLNVTAQDYNSNNINNFSITITRLDGDYIFSDTQNTTNGFIEIGLINGSYNLSIDAAGYEIKSANLTIENVSQTYQFTLYTTNSISFTFKDEETNTIINTEKIEIELISDAYSNNYSTTNGTLYVDLLSPTIYNMRYAGITNYSQERFYYFNLGNRTHTNLTLYLLKNPSNISITIYDQYNSFLEDAYIKVLKYDITTNTYILREIIKSNFAGQGYFSGILNTEYYKFIVEYPFGTIVKETSPSYLYTTSLILKVVLGQDVGGDFDNFMGLNYALTFNNNTNNFKYTYSDTNNVLSQTCLYVYKQNIINGDTLYNSSCSTSSSGTILLNVAEENGTTYIAKAFATLEDESQFIAQISKTFDANKPFKNDKSGIILTIIITLIVAFMFAWNLALFIGLSPLGLTISSLLGLFDVSAALLIGLHLIALVVAILISNKS